MSPLERMRGSMVERLYVEPPQADVIMLNMN
jgi:hypothetical protein